MTKEQVLTHLTFGVTGDDFDPAMITRKLKLTPTRSHKKGDIIKNNPYGKKFDFSKWSLKSKIDPTENLHAHLDELLSILLPHSDEIVELSLNCEIRFYCSIFSGENTVKIRIDPVTLKKICTLEASIVINLY